jgi:hypothetical protein
MKIDLYSNSMKGGDRFSLHRLQKPHIQSLKKRRRGFPPRRILLLPPEMMTRLPTQALGRWQFFTCHFPAAVMNMWGS